MRWRLASATACSAAAVLVAAACGGSGGTTTSARPVLPHDVAARLAAQTDEIRTKLAAGDVEGARRGATALRKNSIAAVNAGRVPQPLQEPLLAAVNRLVALIPAPPPAPTQETKKDDDKKKHEEKKDEKKKDEDKKHGEHDD